MIILSATLINFKNNQTKVAPVDRRQCAVKVAWPPVYFGEEVVGQIIDTSITESGVVATIAVPASHNPIATLCRRDCALKASLLGAQHEINGGKITKITIKSISLEVVTTLGDSNVDVIKT